MAKGILSNFVVFINCHFRQTPFPFEKKTLFACFIRQKDAARLKNINFSASRGSSGERRSNKDQQSRQRNLSSCASATCDQDSPDSCALVGGQLLTTQSGRRHEIKSVQQG